MKILGTAIVAVVAFWAGFFARPLLDAQRGDVPQAVTADPNAGLPRMVLNPWKLGDVRSTISLYVLQRRGSALERMKETARQEGCVAELEKAPPAGIPDDRYRDFREFALAFATEGDFCQALGMIEKMLPAQLRGETTDQMMEQIRASTAKLKAKKEAEMEAMLAKSREEAAESGR